jgi:hypothetical protein
MPRHLIILIGLVSLALQFVESIGGTNFSAHELAPLKVTRGSPPGYLGHRETTPTSKVT